MTLIATWIHVYWPIMVAVGLPIVGVLITSLVSEFGDPDHNPATPLPLWVRLLIVLQKILTARAPEGTNGIFRSRWSIPIFHYPREQKGLALPPSSPPMPPRVAMIPILVLVGFFAGCACFGEKKDTATCVAINKIVDCTVGSVSGLAPAALAAIMSFIAGGQPDWANFANEAEILGFRNAGCLLATLESYLIKPGSSPTAISRAVPLHDVFKQWRVKHAATDIKFCVAPGECL